MYIPSYFSITDTAEIKSFIRENSFATLVSKGDTRLIATHTPLIWKETGYDFVLYGHISKANEHRHELYEKDVLAIFLGPHAYISSQWYDHVNVPTWNYLAVHIYGKASVVEGEELKEAMRSMMDQYEAGSENPMRFDDMPAGFRESEMSGVVGFKIIPGQIEAAFKLSQNRDDKNYNNIIHHLESSSSPTDRQVAEKMKKQQE